MTEMSLLDEMKTAAFFAVIILSLAFAGHAVASRMMGMSIAEFVAWGWRV